MLPATSLPALAAVLAALIPAAVPGSQVNRPEVAPAGSGFPGAAVRTGGFGIIRGKVRPKHSVPASVRPVRIRFRFRAAGPVPVTVRIVRRRGLRTVRSFRLGGANRARPGYWHRVRWNGRTGTGRLARPGSYAVRAGPSGGRLHLVSRFRLHGHLYPIAGPHGVRGPVGEFGAGRTGGRVHEGFDATGRCGTPLVAVRSGRILRVGTDPVLYGNYVVLKGEGERRTYFYAHMRKPALVRRGQRVRAGRRFGAIGRTGNAASTPCHLHIEIRSRGRLLDPEPILRSWEW